MSSSNVPARRAANINTGLSRISLATVENLANIQLDPVLQAALNTMSGELVVRVAANSAVTVTVSQRGSDKVIGTVDDLKKLAGFRSFVTEQKKTSSADALLEPMLVRTTGATAIHRAIPGNEDFLPRPMTADMVAKDREYERNAINLEANRVSIALLSRNSGQAEYSNVERWIDAVDEILGEIAVGLTIGQPKDKGWVTNRLFELQVPAWAYKKLTGEKIPQRREGEGIFDLLYPKDAAKGIYLTIRELRNRDFVSANAAAIPRAQAMRWGLGNDAMLFHVSRLENNSPLTDEADPKVSAILSAKVVIPWPTDRLKLMFEAKAKGKFSSFAAKPDYSSPAKGIATIVAAMVAVCDFTIYGVGDSVESFWGPLLAGIPEVTVEELRGATKARNIFSILVKKWDAVHTRLENFRDGSSSGARSLATEMVRRNAGVTVGNVFDRVRTIMGAIPAGALTWTVEAPSVASYLRQSVRTSAVVDPPRTARWSALSAPTYSRDLRTLIEGSMRVSDFKKKKSGKKAREGLALTPVHKGAKSLLKTIKGKPALAFLAEGLEGWLRGFSTEAMQDAAVNFVLASLDKIVSIEDDEDGASGSDSEDDDDDS